MTHPVYHGHPITPREHAIATEHAHMRACLDELTGRIGANFAGTFVIGRKVRMSGDYASDGARSGHGVNGTYFGSGLPIFPLDCFDCFATPEESIHDTHVRAIDRKVLRAALKARFPHATIGR